MGTARSKTGSVFGGHAEVMPYTFWAIHGDAGITTVSTTHYRQKPCVLFYQVLSPIRPTQDHFHARRCFLFLSPIPTVLFNHYSADRIAISLLNGADPPKLFFRLLGVDSGKQKSESINASSVEFYGRKDKTGNAQAGDVRELFHTPILRMVTLCM